MVNFFGKIRSFLKSAADRYKNRDGCYSPNYVYFVIALVIFCTAVLCGKSVWIPFSRIDNLYVRSAGLAAADAFSAFASGTGLDNIVPRARRVFLSVSGLSDNLAWNEKYFNRRQTGGGFPVSGENPSPSESGDGAAPVPSGENFAREEMPQTTASAAKPSGKVPSLNILHSSANPLRVYMFGDSQVYSLGIGLSRLAGKDSPVHVEYLPVHSSGFIRQDYFSWHKMIEDTFSKSPYNAGVIMLGMNDYQNFWNDDGNVVVKETEGWEAAYRKKCISLIDTALLYLPRIYWLGMPVVKNSTYNSHLAYIEKIQAAVASEYSPDVLVYVPLRDTVPGEGKSYSDVFVTPDGKQIKAMSDDGSHFTVEGGQIVMKPLFDMLCRDFLFSELPIAHMSE